MKKTGLVVGLLVVLLAIASLVAFSDQIRVGSRDFCGKNLITGVRLESDNLFYGKAYLPCSGYLYVFYQGAPSAEQYLILPNLKNQGNYHNAGMTDVPLSMLDAAGNEQKLRFLFSPQRLLNTDFCGIDGNYLSMREIEERGLWCSNTSNFVWVGEIGIPKGFSPTKPYWCSVRNQDWNYCLSKPVPCRYSYRVRPLATPCCPSPCAAIFWWWLFMGILVH